MNATAETSHLPDMTLLLRAYGEQRWLVGEVVPALREIERPHAICEDELPAALAYLEMLWLQAQRLARETDAAAAQLEAHDAHAAAVLVEKAQRYHAAIRRLRVAVGGRVKWLTAPVEAGVPREHASQRTTR